METYRWRVGRAQSLAYGKLKRVNCDERRTRRWRYGVGAKQRMDERFENLELGLQGTRELKGHMIGGLQAVRRQRWLQRRQPWRKRRCQPGNRVTLLLQSVYLSFPRTLWAAITPCSAASLAVGRCGKLLMTMGCLSLVQRSQLQYQQLFSSYTDDLQQHV